jgi:hypothetical protein
MATVSPAVNARWTDGQVVAIGAGSLASTAYGADLTVLLSPSNDCWYTVGVATPTALKAGAGSKFLGKGQENQVFLPKGQLVAVIQDAAVTGTLSITPLNPQVGG